MHPDIVGRRNNGETTFAIEAKGTNDLPPGRPRRPHIAWGSILVFLAAAAVAPYVDILDRQIYIDLLAVASGAVKILDLPAPSSSSLPLQGRSRRPSPITPQPTI